MKKKFKYLMEFLKQFGFDKITQSYVCYDTGLDWGLDEMHCSKDGDQSMSKTIKTPSIVRDLLENFFEHYSGEIEDIVNEVNYGDWSRYDVEVEIYPKQNKLIYSHSFVYYYDTQSESSEYEFDDEDEDDDIRVKCTEFLNGIGNPDDVTITYDGSGDSGYIESYGNTSSGQRVDLPADIEDICYRELGSNFGGWEINEGSNGEIIITNNSLSIYHNWNVETNEEISLDIEVTEDTID